MIQYALFCYVGGFHGSNKHFCVSSLNKVKPQSLSMSLFDDVANLVLISSASATTASAIGFFINIFEKNCEGQGKGKGWHLTYVTRRRRD